MVHKLFVPFTFVLVWDSPTFSYECTPIVMEHLFLWMWVIGSIPPGGLRKLFLVPGLV